MLWAAAGRPGRSSLTRRRSGCPDRGSTVTSPRTASACTSRSAGDAGAPLVVLLHGFPEFWWTWRRQLPALADAGFRAVAVDLRGYGDSDKPPRGYDLWTLAGDVAGLIRALGEPVGPDRRARLGRHDRLDGHRAAPPPGRRRSRCSARRTRSPCGAASCATRAGRAAPCSAAGAACSAAQVPALARAVAADRRRCARRAPHAAAGRRRLGGHRRLHRQRRGQPAGDPGGGRRALRARVLPLGGPVPGARRGPPVRRGRRPPADGAGAAGARRRRPLPAGGHRRAVAALGRPAPASRGARRPRGTSRTRNDRTRRRHCCSTSSRAEQGE